MKSLILITIKAYKKYISSFLPDTCRFHPSCSTYCMEAVDNNGVLKGMWLSLKRILKCHPFHPGGYDPAPICRESQKIK